MAGAGRRAAPAHDGTTARYAVDPRGEYVVGVVADAASQADIPSLSCWAAVPHYAGGSPSPKATLSLLSRLEQLLDTTIPYGDLTEAARAWERGVNELAESDDEVADYVHSLEQAQDAADLPEATGDAIAREFERYLRRKGEEPGPPPPAG